MWTRIDGLRFFEDKNEADGEDDFLALSEDGARCRFRTCDPYRVKVMLYH